LGAPVLNILRQWTFAINALLPKSPMTQRFIHSLYEIEYWIGVYEAGKSPKALAGAS